jgi:hypothetical protein
MLTNDGRCTCEIKSRFGVAKAAFNKNRALFTGKIDWELRKISVKLFLSLCSLLLLLFICYPN